MVDRFVQVDISLETQVAPTASFSEMFLTDEDSVVPTDRRWLRTTRASYTDDLPSGTNAFNFAQAFWSQKRSAQYLYLGRWVKTAEAPYYVTGTTNGLTLADWVSVTDGTFTVQDNAGTPNEDDLTGLNFSTATSVADIATILTAAIQAIGAPNITGLDTAQFEFDNLGRLRLLHSVTGAAAATLTIISEGTGTDLTGATYFDTANGFTIAGLDAEEPTAAVTAIRDLNDDWYKMALRSESAAQQQALAAQFEGLKKQVVFVSGVAADKDPASTTDVPYVLASLNYKNSSVIYTEHTVTATGGWVDAAVDGTVLPATEGTTAWSNESLSAAFSSGKASDSSAKELTTTETTALKDKNCNYIATAGGITFLTPGLNSSGDETRTILGVHWLENVIQNDIFNYNIANPLPAFDEPTLVAYEGIVERRLNEALTRGIIVNTPDRPITITFPTADDFTAAQRASHTMTLSNVFSAYVNSVVNEVVITGTFRI
jgi:hypothetical protein